MSGGLSNPLLKKVLFTGLTTPLLYNTVWAWDWQARRKIEKQKLIDDRLHKLMQDPIIIGDPSKDLPLNTLSKEEFDKKWLYQPVRLKGIIDNDAET